MTHISVIIPVYNVEQYIKKCVESVINQTLKDIEIILVDDGSPDNCPAICDEFQKMDSRIEVIHKENGGLSDARNAGLRAATGEYILFVDSDDWVEESTCEVLFRQTKEHGAELVISGYYIETANNTAVKHIFNENEIVFTPDIIKEKLFRRILGLVKEELRHPEQLDSLSSVWGKLYRRDIISNNRVEFIDTKTTFSESIDFNFKYTHHVNTAVYLDIPFYHYRRTNTASITTAYKDDFFRLIKNWTEYVANFIEEHNYHDLLDEALYSRICLSVIACGGYALRAGSLKQSFTDINTFLNDAALIEAFKHFSFAFLPIHWKVFFYMAKRRMIWGFFLITKAMRKRINKKRGIK